MPRRKTIATIKQQVIAALKKKFTTVPEIMKQTGSSKAYARTLIYGLGRKVRRQRQDERAFTAYKLR